MSSTGGGGGGGGGGAGFGAGFFAAGFFFPGVCVGFFFAGAGFAAAGVVVAGFDDWAELENVKTSAHTATQAVSRPLGRKPSMARFYGRDARPNN
jgi:hypothetical protein